VPSDATAPNTFPWRNPKAKRGIRRTACSDVVHGTFRSQGRAHMTLSTGLDGGSHNVVNGDVKVTPVADLQVMHHT